MLETQATMTVPTRLGPISYRVIGNGPVTVLAVHGLLFDGRLWDGVAQRLAARATVILPDFPFGAHRTAVPDRSKLTPLTVAAAFVDVLDALSVPTAVLLGNDTGGALAQIAASLAPERFTALALTSSDAFTEFPPTLFKPVAKFSHLPGVTRALLWAFSRAPLLARPGLLNLLARSPIDPALVKDWLRPASTDRAVRDDLIAWMRSLDSRYTLDAAEKLRSYPGSAVVAWSRQDRLFPASHAERLVALLPKARLVWIDDALTLSPLDQPGAVAEAVLSLLDELVVPAVATTAPPSLERPVANA